MLAMFVGEHRNDWDDLLPAVMIAYRSSVHESTGFSPYQLMFGEECTLPMDVGPVCSLDQKGSGGSLRPGTLPRWPGGAATKTPV